MNKHFQSNIAELPARRVFFSNPDRTQPLLSPDGKFISWLGAANGVRNVSIAPTDATHEPSALTHAKGNGIALHDWTYSGRHLLIYEDEHGDENFRISSVDVLTGEQRPLTPASGVRAVVEAKSPKFPTSVLVRHNERDSRFFDVYRVDLTTGNSELVFQNDGYSSTIFDYDFVLRFAVRTLPPGGYELIRFDKDGTITVHSTVAAEDDLTTKYLGISAAGDTLYFVDARGRDTAALFAQNLPDGTSKLLASHPKADIGNEVFYGSWSFGVLFDERSREPIAAKADYLKAEWLSLEPAIEADFAAFANIADGVPSFQFDLEMKRALVTVIRDDGPLAYYLYDRSSKTANLLFHSHEALSKLKLRKMEPVLIKSRDGLDLVSYVTRNDEAGPGPMVLYVHGGPWYRDVWGLDVVHQWLASRGYSVLSVNYRGSTGFGKAFLNAGNKEWGAKMHDDLIDAVNWAVDEGIADPKKIGIMGASYGGYATLIGLTMTPDVFACGVDIVGQANLITLFNSVPPYWVAGIAMFKERVGDKDTPEGQELLRSRSPLTYADRITKPLLIGQGANDVRVLRQEPEQIVAAMQKHGLPVTYVVYSDEGHCFLRPENQLSFYAVAEAFLGEHLGGTAEPIGDDFEGSSISIEVGKELVTIVA